MSVGQIPEADTSLRAELARAARELLEAEGGLATTRAIALEGDQERGMALWAQLCELGWPGVEVAEAEGGLGAGVGELIALLAELGRVAAPVPILGTAVLGLGALSAAGDAQRRAWMPRVLAGEARITAALTAADGTLAGAGATVEGGDRGRRLSGQVGFVPDLPGSDACVVAARDERGGTGIFLVERSAPGVHFGPRPTVDPTRSLGCLRLEEAVVAPETCLLAPGEAESEVARLLDRAAVALAADSLGGAERALESTVAYLGERRQFGRPIGSFQALKHRCADMLMRVTGARAALELGVAGLEGEGRPLAASIAKAYATEAYVHVASEMVQLHGGIGYTWEHDAHVLLKRAKLNEALFGSPGWHRERIAALTLPPS